MSLSLARLLELNHGLDQQALYDALLERENRMVGQLHVAGAQFGLFAEIVAEVLAEVGLGTPLTESERTIVRANFTALMERIQRENNQ